MAATLVSTHHKNFRWALGLLIGSSAALSYANQFTDFWTWSIAEQIFLGFYFVILFTLAAYGLVFYFTWPRLLAFQGWAKLLWIVMALLLGGLLIIAIPIEIPLPVSPGPRQHSLEIVATGDKNPKAQASEVWIQEARPAGDLTIPIDQVQLIGSWKIQAGVLRLLAERNQAASLRWTGPLNRNLLLTFVSHPQSGVVQVRWDDQQQQLDLYGETLAQRTITLPVEILNWPELKWGLLATGLYLAYALSLAVLGLSLTVWLATRPAGNPDQAAISPWAWFYYALPCAIVWTVGLLAFWPGEMDYDSLTQWEQMQSGRLVDWHPAFHTMTNWLITRLWLSPAAIALVQIALLSVIAGWGLARIQRLGAPASLVWVICLLFAFLPANGSMIITIEKSVLYSVGMLLLTLLTLEIVVSKGAWLQKRGAWVIIGSLLALIMLFRYNGFTTGLGVLVLLMVFYRQYWRQLIAALVLTVGLWLGVRGPLYDRWEVNKIEARGPAMAPFLYHIAAHIAGGTPLSAEEVAFLSTIHPLEDKWKYDCYSPVPLFFGSDLNWFNVMINSSKITQIWWDLTRRNPWVILNHFACNSTLIWQITKPAATYLYASVIHVDSAGQVHTFIDDKAFLKVGLRHQSKLPTLEYPLAWWITRTQAPDLSWLIWQPAIYLYLAVIGVTIGAIRLKSWRYLLVLGPISLHSLPLMLAILGRDFRYQYPVYLVGLLVGMLFLLGMPLKRSEA